MKRKIYKGGVDNYPLWWYGQSNRLQNFGDRPNFLIPHGAVFQGNGYYFNSANSDYMEDIYGRHLIKEGTNGLWSRLYLTNSAVPPCGSAVGTGDKLYLANDQDPKIAGKIILYSRGCPNLSTIECKENLISELNVSQIINLKVLWCYSNQLAAIDITQLKKMKMFGCNYNQITKLDVSQSTKLEWLYCHYNQIPALDVSQNSLITILQCNNNLMGQSAVDKVLVDANNWGTSDGTLDISGNTAPSQTGIDAKNDLVNRNWTVTTD